MKQLVLLLCLTAISALKAQSPISFNGGDQTIDKGFKTITHLGPQSEPKDALKAIAEGKAKWVTDSTFNPEVKSYWLDVTLSNPKAESREVILNYHSWSFVNVYELDSQSRIVKTHPTGHLYPYNKRDYPLANKSLVHLTLKEKSSTRLLVHLVTAFNNDLAPKNLSFTISDKAIIDKSNDIIGKGIYAFLAIFLISLLYNLFIYLSTRLKSYLYYLLVLIMAMYHTAYNSGYIIEIFGSFSGFPQALTYFERISSALLGTFVILFVQQFLDTKTRYPGWHKILNVLIILNWVGPLLNFVNKDLSDGIGSLIGLAGVFAIVWMGIKAVKDRIPSALYFLLGYSAFMLSVVVIILYLAGAIPFNLYVVEFALPIGSTIEIALFSMALGNMINVLRSENEMKQARIIAQLEENELLQTQVNRELETKVRERTEEIMVQKQIIEAEKEKADILLLNILPVSTANELKDKGYSTPKLFSDVTVLFTDFASFTGISKHLSPEELVRELDDCFKAFDAIVSEYKLEKIKTIGDAYMAMCGAPDPNPDHAVNTILAAKKMIDFIKEWNIEKQQNQKDTWDIRVGIHTGPVIAGVVGQKKFSFDIWGDTVNIASRMESGGTPGRINISTETCARIKDRFTTIPRGLVEVKNGLELEMFYVEP